MIRQPTHTQQVWPRSALALAILLTHMGLIVMVTYNTTATTKPPLEAPILVALLPERLRTPDNLTLSQPALALPRSVSLALPQVELPAEGSDASPPAASGTHTDQQEPAASAPQPARSVTLETLSTVDYVQRPVPSYPRESRLAHEEGLVVLRVLIDELGHARDIEIYRSSGHPRLDREARAAVARAIFKPYVAGGAARTAIAMVPIEFSLRGKSS